ncbi:MAG: hypothetical protein QME88_11500 [Actinomycetota bacterium]|nr:hypothetical protein [Actinomycetota bacterium]
MYASRGERITRGLVILACLAVLAWLNGRYVGRGGGQVAAFSLIGLALALACLAGLAALLMATSPPLRQAGYASAWDAVSRGYLLLVPFALLALLADLAFGWSAATAFMQAAVMTSGAAVGAELMRAGEPKLRYMIAPMAGAFLFSIIWIAYAAIFTSAAGPKAVG